MVKTIYNIWWMELLLHRVQKKGATDFFAVTFTNTDFHNFSCTTSQ